MSTLEKAAGCSYTCAMTSTARHAFKALLRHGWDMESHPCTASLVIDNTLIAVGDQELLHTSFLTMRHGSSKSRRYA